MRLKVIHLITSIKRGGRERQLATIIKNSNRVQYPSKVIYLNERTPNYIHEYGLSDKTRKVQARVFVSRLFEINALLKKEKSDIIYTWGNLETIFILLLKPFHNFKFINGSIRHGIRSKKFWHFFRTIILHLSKNIVANSYAGLKANNLKRGYVLYNGIEDKFIGTLSKYEKLEKRKTILNSDDERLVFISVANLVPYKDYFSVLEALKIIKNEGYNFLYLILGDGPLRNKIENKIVDYGLINNVKIIGNVENVYDYLKIADIFIHSSKGEGCSNAILEAMAAGLPIIASNTGGTKELVNDNNGLLFNYKDHLQLYMHLKWCVDNTEICKSMGYESYKAVDNDFSLDSMMNKYYKILNSVMSKNE